MRLPIRNLERLQTLVDKGEYDTISDAVRAAIDRLLAVKFPPEHLERITIDLPKGKAVELEHLVRRGDSISLEDAIRNAVREYVRTQLGKSEARERV